MQHNTPQPQKSDKYMFTIFLASYKVKRDNVEPVDSSILRQSFLDSQPGLIHTVKKKLAKSEENKKS